MQDGGNIELGTNENIVFLITYTISFPKMYSFYTFQRSLAEILRWPFCKMHDGGHIGLGANENNVFLTAYTIVNQTNNSLF